MQVKGKKASVKKELCRLLKPGPDDTPPPVQRVAHGLYACFLGPAELQQLENPQPKVHALQLVWKLPGQPPFGGSPPRSRAHTRGAMLDAGFGAIHADGAWTHDDSSRSWRCRRWHGNLKVTLQAFPTTGTLMASVDSSLHPLGATELGHLRTFLEATVQAEGFTWTEPRVATVEVNRDFKRVRLAGREAARFYLGRMAFTGEQALQLRHLEGALVQVYNKHQMGVMRQEIRLQPRDLDLQNLQALVVSMFYGPLPPQEQPSPLTQPDGGYA